MKNPDIHYTAYFVDNPAQLLEQFPPRHKNTYAHHSTNVYKPESLDGVEVGFKTKLKILGRVFDDRCDALIVENPKSKNAHPHITLSCADGIKSFYSHTLLEQGTPELFSQPFYVDVTEGYMTMDKEVVLYN